MPRKKKPRGRPIQTPNPGRITDTPKNVISSLLRTRPKEERRLLKRRGDKAAGGA